MGQNELLIKKKLIIPPIPFWIKKQLHRPKWNLGWIIESILTPNKEEQIKKKLRKLMSVRRVILCESGTMALYWLLRTLSIGNEKKEVIIPSYCCKTVANAVIEARLTPHFVDVEDDFMISVKTVKPAVNKKTLAIIVPHMYGNEADVKAIIKAFPHLVIIEDKAMRLQGKLVAPYGILSFNIGKQIQSTGGGAILIK
jgi:dTDP-4-amino-4,6-dideoxygalactose transaminase